MTNLGRATKSKDRVLIDESVLSFYHELRSDANSEPEEAPFELNKDVFMFAVCLGYVSGKRQLLPSGSKSDIRSSTFTERDHDILKAVAIAETGNVEVLADPAEILNIAEEYAHGGIYDVKAALLDERGQPLWNLVRLLNSVRDEERDPLLDFDNLARELD